MVKITVGTVVGLLIAAGLWNVPAQGFGHQSHEVTHVTDQDARNYYDYINAEYYGDTLPKASIRFVPNLTGPDDNGKNVPALEEYIPTDPPQILIDNSLRDFPTITFLYEIHESCHIYVDKHTPEFEQHGPNFQKCMLDKAERGAFKDLW